MTAEQVTHTCRQCNSEHRYGEGIDVSDYQKEPTERIDFCSIDCLREWLLERSGNDE